MNTSHSKHARSITREQETEPAQDSWVEQACAATYVFNKIAVRCLIAAICCYIAAVVIEVMR